MGSIKQSQENKQIGSVIVRKNVTGSTNADAMAEGAGLPHGAVITAEAQTAGKGRRGRSWLSEAGENLYFSLILKPDFAPDKAPMLTLLMALAVVQGIKRICRIDNEENRGSKGQKQRTDISAAQKISSCPETTAENTVHDAMSGIQIKWPNDIVINGRKVCGILTEMQLEGSRIGQVVIGVGINIGPRDFAAEGLPHASSLVNELGINWGIDTQSDVGECNQACTQMVEGTSDCHRPNHIKDAVEPASGYELSLVKETLLQHILQSFAGYYEQFCLAGTLTPFKKEYEACLANLNKEVRVLDPKGEFSGVALGIDDEGQLLVRKENDTIEAVYAGEVSVRGLYGYL